MDRFLARARATLSFMREPRRVITVCLTVALGTLALIIADGFIDHTFFVFREDIIRAHYAHVQVLPEDTDGRFGGDASGGELRRIVEREMAAYPGAVVAGRLGFAGLIAFNERTVGFIGEGIEPINEAALSKAVRLSAGAPLAAGRDDQALLGEGLARSLGAAVGDRVTLLSTVPGGGINAVEVEVAGVFHTATKAYDDRALRLSITTAHRLTRSSGVSRLMVLLPDTDLAGAAALRLRESLSGQRAQVKPWTELADFYNKTVDLFARQLNFVRTVILAIVLLATFNSLARNVLERQREIGTMMALGARRAAVARQFVTEALVIGAAGGGVGVALGGVIAWGVTRIGIPMPPPPGTAHGFMGGIGFSAANVVAALGAVLIVCLVASLVPARRAAGVTIVDALRTGR